MDDELGRILDAMAFHSMSNRSLIELIANQVVERQQRRVYFRYNLSTLDMIKMSIDELVVKYGSVGGSLTRVKLAALVLKRIRSKESRVRTLRAPEDVL